MQKLQKAAIVWFRNDLRIHDHEPLKRAIDSSQGKVVSVYCFDPRQYQKTYYFGFPRSGPLRCRFTIESLQNLRTSLRDLGSDLIVTIGTPETVLPQIAQTLQSNNFNVTGVFAHKDIFDEEIKQENNVAKHLPLGLSWGALTMYHIDDLPFKINKKDPLAIYTQFRQQIETSGIKVRNLVPMPQQGSLGNFNEIFGKFLNTGDIPTVSQLLVIGNNEKFFDSPIYQERSDLPKIQGGEKEGIERLNYYIWKQQLIKTYKDTRNGLLGNDYASKFSIWLANGCLSPRFIYHQIKKFESIRGANDSTYWLWFELLWRDYFKWIAMKHGNDLFHLRGIKENYEDNLEWRTDKELFLKWAHGKTGYPFVDANMRELNATGFMSNRGRQNVASFLTKDLKLDWRMGAEYFESVLIDFDVSSNYGNWEYVSGVGNDPRQGRYFNVVKQAYDYDEKAEYVSFWIPELKRLPNVDMKHRPSLMSAEEQKKYNFNIEKDYCLPLVDVKYARDNKRNTGRNQIKITKYFNNKPSQQIKA